MLVPAPGDLDLVLATDLDGTLVGEPHSLAWLNAWLSSRRREVFLIYLTGRHSLAAWNLIAEEPLLLPDVLVSDLGTEMRPRPRYRRDRQWESRFAEQWPLAAVEATCARLPYLSPQPWRPPWRRSYDLAAGGDTLAVARALAHLPVRLVFSGRQVDVIPRAAGKGAALAYLVPSLGLPAGRLVVCGDSGNDLDMVGLGFASVVVANGELAARPLPPNAYLASGASAAGILEGLSHYGWPVPGWAIPQHLSPSGK